MVVSVLADNPYRAFYESLGGQPVSTHKIDIGGTSLDGVSYGWHDITTLLGQGPA